MRRQNVIKEILNVISDNDIAVFGGSLIKESNQYDRDGNFYIDNKDLVLSISLGISISTTKKVFVFCDAVDFLREFSTTLQIAVSKCRNIIYIILNSGYYSELNLPSVFEGLYSPVSTMFSLGITSHNFTYHFKDKKSLKELGNIFRGLKGPMCLFINIDNYSSRNLSDIDISKENLKNRLSNFISN